MRLSRTKKARVIAAALVVGLVLFANTFRASPLPAPEPFAGAWPIASSPEAMAIFQLPTGVTHRTAAFGYRGGSFFEARDFSMTAVLVKHPRGDVLIDTGLGSNIDTQIQEMPWWFRASTRYTRGRSAASQLDAAGYDRRSLRSIILTHAHWDHASGLEELPDIPVEVTAEEHRFIANGGWISAIARNAKGARYEEYELEGGPYLGFDRSHDLYGDGAIVIVPAPGHTPGSVIVFVTLPSGARWAFVGDLVWQLEGITEREERPWLVRSLADSDPEGVRAGILRMSALSSRFPELRLVPSHDGRGFHDIPSL